MYYPITETPNTDANHATPLSIEQVPMRGMPPPAAPGGSQDSQSTGPLLWLGPRDDARVAIIVTLPIDAHLLNKVLPANTAVIIALGAASTRPDEDTARQLRRLPLLLLALGRGRDAIRDEGWWQMRFANAHSLAYPKLYEANSPTELVLATGSTHILCTWVEECISKSFFPIPPAADRHDHQFRLFSETCLQAKAAADIADDKAEGSAQASDPTADEHDQSASPETCESGGQPAERRRSARRPAWRPTEMQIDAVAERARNMGDDDFCGCNSLYGREAWLFGMGLTAQERARYRRDAGRALLNLVKQGAFPGLAVLPGSKKPVLYYRENRCTGDCSD